MAQPRDSEVLLPAERLSRDSHTEPQDVEEDTRFPWKQIAALALCRLAEPIAFSSITAYAFKMVQHIKGVENASFYSGLLVSAFALSEALASMFWGNLSDRWGRKPIIIISLAGNVCSSLLFGLSPNYWVAFTARVLGGVLNGNISVMQTMVAEIAKRPEHEPIAYAMQPFIWSLGSIAGAALGGYTAEPAKSYPHLFSQGGVFGKFPYLLPNVVAASITVIALIQGMIFLQETNETVLNQRKPTDTEPQIVSVDEHTPLRTDSTSQSSAAKRKRRSSSISQIGIERSYDPRRPSFDSTAPLLTTLTAPTGPGEIRAFTKEVILWTIELFLMSYHQIAFSTLMTIYLLDKPRQPPQHLDLIGGLGRTLPQVGTFLAVDSVIGLFVQGIIYPYFIKWTGVWKTALICSILAPIVHAVVPLVALLPMVDIGVYASLFSMAFCSLIVFPCLMILLKNATPSMSVLGRVNGLALALCSGGRTFAPPVLGLVYSHFGSAAAWWHNAVVALIAVVLLVFIPRSRSMRTKNGE